MDLSSVLRSIQAGLNQVPPVAIGLALLAGPTLALVIFRFISMARRGQAETETITTPLWVCHSCRSINDLHAMRCYRCGNERDALGKIEIVIDRQEPQRRMFEAPEGSPFAAVTDTQPRGVPVMGPASGARGPVPVGPGHDPALNPASEDASSDLVEADR